MKLKPIIVASLMASLLFQPLAALAAAADASSPGKDPLSVIEGKLSISLSIVSKKALKLKTEGADISEARKYILEARQYLFIIDPTSVATSTASSTLAMLSASSSPSGSASSTSEAFLLKKPKKPLTATETRETLKKAQKAILQSIDALRKAIEIEQQKLTADSTDDTSDSSTAATTTVASPETSTSTDSVTSEQASSTDATSTISASVTASSSATEQ